MRNYSQAWSYWKTLIRQWSNQWEHLNAFYNGKAKFTRSRQKWWTLMTLPMSLMGILKPCFIVKKVPEISDGTAAINSHSKPEMKSSKSIQESQTNCSASVNIKKLVKTTATPKDVQHIHPDSLKSTQEMIETTYQDVFQGLGKFPGEPYKLRLKENYVPAKHQPWKVPVHLQDAFHEEVQRLIKIDVLEPVTEQTEWVNSYVIVGKKWRLIQAMPTVWATQSRRFNCV